jgi:hypothetical protein
MGARILVWVIVAIVIALVLPQPIPPQRPGKARKEFELVSETLEEMKGASAVEHAGADH